MNVFRPVAFEPIGIVDKEVTRLHCYAILAMSDVAAIAIAFLCGNFLASRWTHAPLEHGTLMLAVILPIFAVHAASNGAYGADTLEDARLGTRRSVQALMIAAGVVLLIAYVLKASGDFSRAVFGLGLAGSALLLASFRRFLRPHLMNRLGGAAHMTVVLRDGVDYERQHDEIVLSAERLNFDPSTTDPHDYHLLARTLAHADRLIVACVHARAPAWANVLRSLAIDGEIFTDLHDELGAISMRAFGDRRTLVITAGPLTLSSRAIKRAFDLAVSIPALIFLAPLLLGIAAAIRWESPGPVLFRQARIGRDNKIFTILKFRSMFTDAADQSASRLVRQGDERVTRIGKFIRRTSIDELPQLLNVLRGEMSIVGPRPHALAAKAADVLYWDVDTRYRQRHVIKPGMTGLAQVRGFRGNTYQLVDLTNRLQADLEYAANWSLRHDLSIILRTLRVFAHENAY